MVDAQKMVLDAENVRKTQKAYAAEVDKFLQPEKAPANVVGMGYGVKWSNGEPTGKPALLAMVTPDVVGQGVRAGDIIREVAPEIDGRGGGRPELAEAGGKDPSGLDRALAAVVDVVNDKRSATAS